MYNLMMLRFQFIFSRVVVEIASKMKKILTNVTVLFLFGVTFHSTRIHAKDKCGKIHFTGVRVPPLTTI